MKKALAGIIAIVVLSFLVGGYRTEVKAAEPQAKLPKVVAIGSYRVGSLAYLIAQGFAVAIKEKTGTEVRLVPIGTDFAKFLSLSNKEVEIGFSAASDCYQASRGLRGYEKLGILKVRMVWAGTYVYGGLAVRGNSSIRTLKDLKGKICAGTPWQTHIPAGLAFAGLKPDDVEFRKMEYPEYCKAVINGQADAAWFTPQAPIALEAENGPQGFRMLAYGPPEEKEAWDRYFSVAARAYFPYRATIGAYVGKNPTWMPGTRQVLFTDDSVSADWIYAIVKALDTGYDIYKKVAEPDSIVWNLEETLNVGEKGSTVPWHPGFVRYAREKGLWTSKQEDLQKRFLMDEEERIRSKNK